MIDEKFRNALKIVVERFKKNNIQWAVIGSVGLALNEIKISSRDLDITVKLSDFQLLNNIFNDYIPFGEKRLQNVGEKSKPEILLNIKDVQIQIVGDFDDGYFAKQLLNGEIQYINIDDIQIPCFSLEALLETYKIINHPERVELIKKFLDINKNGRFAFRLIGGSADEAEEAHNKGGIYYFYVLQFKKNKKLYKGFTDNLKRRISEHRYGQSSFTSRNGDFDLIFYEAYVNKKDAEVAEKYFKSGHGREVLKEKLKYYFGRFA